MARPGFDTSPLLDNEFNKASVEYLKSIKAPVAPDESTPDLLSNTIKRLNVEPTARQIVFTMQKTGFTEEQIREIWSCMWLQG